jgi:glycosyltransferase involved in cell wall biosynthesis
VKVLMITSSYPADRDDARGIFIHRLARSVARLGADVSVISPATPDTPREYALDGVAVNTVRYWIPGRQRLATGPAGIVPNLRASPRLLAQVPPLFSALTWRALRLAPRFDVIHSHWVYPAGLAGAIARSRATVPLVVSSHGTDLRLTRRSRLLRRLARAVCSRADACVGISHALCDELRALGVPEDRIHFLPLGVDPPQSAGADGGAESERCRRFRDFDGLRLVYVGRLVPVKSVETLIEAHRELQRRGRRVATAIVGSGPDERRLRALARDSGCANVFFAGQQSPIATQRWLSAADVLVLTSVSEGRGVVIMEAMAQGLAVIATDIPGPRELVDDGETGFLFPAGDAGTLADRIRVLAADPTLRRHMGEHGRARLEAQGLMSDQVARRYLALYERVTAPEPGFAPPPRYTDPKAR